MATTTPNNGWAVPTSTDYVAQGAVAIETLGDAIDASVGTGLLAWTAYTPTFQNLTVGNGTSAFYYVKIGKTVHVTGRFTLGTTSSFGTSVNVSMPVTMDSNYGSLQLMGSSMYFGTSTTIVGTLNLIDSTYLRLFIVGSAVTYANLINSSATVPFTWASTNSFNIHVTYEAA
jgi:hypothetical protein